MSQNTELEQVEKQIEVSIDAARGAVSRKDAVARLFKNRDFKKVFEDGYFRDEAARLVNLMTDPEFSGEDRQTEIHNDMVGISATRQYLLNIHRLGVQMERQIASSEAELESLRNEEQEGA